MMTVECLNCTRCLNSRKNVSLPINDLELCDRGPSEFNNLPYLSISSPISDVPHLASIDIDSHIPVGQNFQYYSVHDFHSDYEIGECLSDASSFFTMHCNIRSLSANFNNFFNMLAELYFPLSLIGISETRIRDNRDLLHEVNLPGYDIISQPSITAAGGVAFYIKKVLNMHLGKKYLLP